MEQGDFWALMRAVGPRPGEDDFDRLTDELATRSAEDITGFEDRLTALLYALDTPAHVKAARAGNDWFLYVRCAAVAAGRDAYEEILAEPAKLRRFAHREAEVLLSVASRAYERSTGMLWEHETQLSYESGSNTAAWGEPEPDPDRPEHPEPTPAPWLRLHSTIFLPDGWPAAYSPLVHHIQQAVLVDPAWQAWWSAAGVPECQLSLLFRADEDLGPTGTTVKVGRTRVEAMAIRQPEPFTSTDPQELLPRAVDDVTSLFDAVRIRLNLAPLPPINTGDLPADLPQGLERPLSMGALVADLGPRNILKALALVLLGPLRRGKPKS
jgi:hypothetical protein